tara:strand:+ start:406 stop:1440 length:1035 start_codon:yes stop_codon:yes gene_type:complete
MIKDSTEIFIEGKSIDFTQASLKIRGGNTAGELNFVMPAASTSYRKYWNKEVTVFFQKGDSVPLFRGRILDTVINANNNVKFRAVNVYGFLTGHQRARVVMNDEENIDGLSAGASIIKMIRMANLNNIIGTDFIGDTSPIIQNTKPRGVITILNQIDNFMKLAIDVTNEDLPRQNILVVKDDGTKSQLRIEARADIENEIPIKFYTYDTNIISFQVRNRHIPTTIVVEGKGIQATFTHDSAATAMGEFFLEITNQDLESEAECMDFAQKIFRANDKSRYEYALDTIEGVYLQENDVIYITDEQTGIEGNFRVIGKTLVFSPNSFKLSLTINRRPPILGEYLQAR